MEKHCVSLELSKELAKNGWKKETEFYWWYDKYTKKWKLITYHKSNFYPAPLATEVLEELPLGLEIYKSPDSYEVSVIEHRNDRKIDKSLPNALAKLWLYLKKEGLLSSKNCKED